MFIASFNKIMYNSEIKHTYSEKPWRGQLRKMGTYFAGLIGLMLLAIFSLSITTQIATYGRFAQDAKVKIIDIQGDIRDLETKIASATTSKSLEERAIEDGYHKVLSYEVIYLAVDGYAGDEVVDFSVEFELDANEIRDLPADFTISWIEWIELRLREWAYERD